MEVTSFIFCDSISVFELYLNIIIYFFQARLNAPSLANLRNIPSTDGNYRATRHEFWKFFGKKNVIVWIVRFSQQGCFRLNLLLLFCFSLSCFDFTENIWHQFEHFLKILLIFIQLYNFCETEAEMTDKIYLT